MIKDLAVAWNFMWAFSYIVVAIIDPGVGGPPVLESFVTFLVFGIALLAATYVKAFAPSHKTAQTIAKYMLYLLAGASVYSGIATFVGMQIWVVPFPTKKHSK